MFCLRKIYSKRGYVVILIMFIIFMISRTFLGRKSAFFLDINLGFRIRSSAV